MMVAGNFTDDFKRNAVAQITERAIPSQKWRSGSGSVSTRFMRGSGSSRSH